MLRKKDYNEWMVKTYPPRYKRRMSKSEFDEGRKSETANNLDSELGLTPMTSLGVVSNGVSSS